MADWFDSVLSFVGDNLGPILGGALAAGGAYLAADLAADANRQAAQTAAAAKQAEIDAINRAANLAQQRFQTVYDETAPARERLLAVSAGDPYALTPAQQAELEKIQQNMNAYLATSGLRGAGRAGVAAFNDATAKATQRFQESNLARTDRVSTDLAGQGFTANREAAGIDERTGQRVGAGLSDIGEIQAGADLASARGMGAALSGLGGIIAGEIKSAGRKPRYADGRDPVAPEYRY